MDTLSSTPCVHARPQPTSIKVLVTGGSHVGKTALVDALSEIGMLRIEEALVDTCVTTVAPGNAIAATLSTSTLDFGRITIDEALILYLLNTPTHPRTYIHRDEITLGAIGAVILADPLRLDECLSTIRYFKGRGTPYIVAINNVDQHHDEYLMSVRKLLNIEPHIPVSYCNPHLRESCKKVLITLLEYVKSIVQNQTTIATIRF